MVVFLLLVGLGPVAFLSERVDRASRLALAPAFGLAIAMCVLVTTSWRVPLDHSFWLLPLLAGLSLAVAAWRARRASPQAPERAPWRIGRSACAQLLVVVLVVSISLAQPLVRRDSVGPVGYAVADAGGYVLEEDGVQQQSIYAAEHQHPPWRNLTIQQWHAYAASFQEVGFDPVVAGMDALLGLGATQTFSSFLIALLLVGAFGAYAAVRVAARTRSWAAPLAGVLIGGPFSLQLFMDGSQGAIAGLALVLAMVVVGCLALRERHAANWLLFALLAAGLQTAYPLFVPPFVVGGAVVLLMFGIQRLRAGITSSELLRAGGTLIGVLILAAVLTPVAFERNVRYWRSILDGAYMFTKLGLPVYSLPIDVLPGWLTQTRDFYYLPHLGMLSAQETLNSIFIPLLLIGVICYGIWRRRVVAIALPIAGTAALLAYYTMLHDECSYCVQRNLLLLQPLTAAGIGVGIAALIASQRRATRWLALAVAVIALVAIVDKTLDSARREANSAYVFDRQTRQALSAAPRSGPPGLVLEGFGQGPKAQMEEPLVYAATEETLGRPPSITAESDDNHGMQYLGGPRPVGVEFEPSYRYVLTRLGGIRTPRRTIARYGPIALQERARPLDAIVTSGVDVALARNDPSGQAWVQPVPLTVWITGASPQAAVWTELNFRITTPGPVQVGTAANVVTTSARTGSSLAVCLEMPRAVTLRRAAVVINFTAIPQPPRPHEEFGIPDPPEGVRLEAVKPLERRCALATTQAVSTR